ncbi:hypothetical protein [Salibacterium aidingense]|uniref:hypothetical protein n=1 Tax=Salibacterium aidingense TaxID=384933 RepID=UPI003BCFC872
MLAPPVPWSLAGGDSSTALGSLLTEVTSWDNVELTRWSANGRELTISKKLNF